jgi:hypothetical protein
MPSKRQFCKPGQAAWALQRYQAFRPSFSPEFWMAIRRYWSLGFFLPQNAGARNFNDNFVLEAPYRPGIQQGLPALLHKSRHFFRFSRGKWFRY